MNGCQCVFCSKEREEKMKNNVPTTAGKWWCFIDGKWEIGETIYDTKKVGNPLYCRFLQSFKRLNLEEFETVIWGPKLEPPERPPELPKRFRFLAYDKTIGVGVLLRGKVWVWFNNYKIEEFKPWKYSSVEKFEKVGHQIIEWVDK